MSAVNNKFSLEALGTLLGNDSQNIHTGSINSENSEKNKVKSYPSSMIQKRVTELKSERTVGHIFFGGGLSAAIFFTILWGTAYFASSHPATMNASSLELILGVPWGVGGSFMLIGIAISSVYHWKLKRKLSNDEIQAFIKKEEENRESCSKKLKADKIDAKKRIEKLQENADKKAQNLERQYADHQQQIENLKKQFQKNDETK